MALACPPRFEGVGYAIAIAGPITRVAPRAAEFAERIRAVVDLMG